MVEHEPQLLHKRVRRYKKRGTVPLLIYALDKGDLPLSQLFLDLGSDPDTTAGRGKRPALHWVLSGKSEQAIKPALIRLLISRGANTQGVDLAGRNVFHALVETGAWEDKSALHSMASKLASNSPALEAPDNRGLSPLMAAVMRHDANFAALLIQLGADPLKKSAILGIDASVLAEQQSHTIDHPKEAAQVLKVVNAAK